MARIPEETRRRDDPDGNAVRRARQGSSGSATDGYTTVTYDAVGRQTSVTDPDGSTASSLYSVHGAARTTQITDEAGVQRTLQYDGLGRLTGVTEAAGSAAYTYDVLDDLTQVSQTDTSTGLTQYRSFNYDSLKRLKSATNPESGIVNYTYDANGNVLTKTDARFTTSSGYDALNRINHISFNDPKTPSVGFCYDGFPYVANQGNCGTTPAGGQWMRRTASAAWLSPSGITTDVSSTSYSYDIAGRLEASTQTTGGSGYPFSYTYYNDDRLASIRYPSNRLVTTCYDSNGRVTWVDGTPTPPNCTGVGTDSKAYANVSAYWPQGAINSVSLGNGLTETTTYNNRLQMTNKATNTIGGVSRLGLQLSFCAYPQAACSTGNNGNLNWQTISYDATPGIEAALSVTQTYAYNDGVNRLTNFAELGIAQTYGYDGFGNRWLVSSANLPVSNLTPASKNWFWPSGGGAPSNQILPAFGALYDPSGNGNQTQMHSRPKKEAMLVSSRSIADFDGHQLTEGSEGGLDLLGLGGVFGIEHAADHALVESQTAGQIGVVDLLIAHRQVERELRRQPQRHGHQALTTLCG